MAYIELPVAADTPHQSFSVTLNGTVFGFKLRYNSRAGHWALDLYDAGANPLLSGIAIRLGVDLLAQYAGDTLPAGSLFAINWVDAYSEPDRDNFGSDVSLVYEEA
jgi:hypothetical protein